MINDNLSIVYKLQQRLSRQSRYGPTAEVMAAFLPPPPVCELIDALLGGRDGVIEILGGVNLSNYEGYKGKRHTHNLYFGRDKGSYIFCFKDDERSFPLENERVMRWIVTYIDCFGSTSSEIFKEKNPDRDLDTFIAAECGLKNLSPAPARGIEQFEKLTQNDVTYEFLNTFNDEQSKIMLVCSKTHDGETFERLDPKDVLRTLRDVGGYDLPPLLEEKAQATAEEYQTGFPQWSPALQKAIENQGR